MPVCFHDVAVDNLKDANFLEAHFLAIYEQLSQ
jgi:hypothetical protein